jgi:outer membrane protein
MARITRTQSWLTLSLAAFAFTGIAHADTKIGVVNVQALLEESPQAKAASQALQDEFAPRQRDLQQKQKELQAKQDKLNRDGATMTEGDKNTLEKELRNGERDLQAKGESFTEELNSRRNEELGKVQNALLQEVQTYAKANGFDLVVPTNAVLFSKDAFDITTQVLAAWQSHSGSATAKPAAKPATPAPATKPAK